MASRRTSVAWAAYGAKKFTFLPCCVALNALVKRWPSAGSCWSGSVMTPPLTYMPVAAGPITRLASEAGRNESGAITTKSRPNSLRRARTSASVRSSGSAEMKIPSTPMRRRRRANEAKPSREPGVTGAVSIANGIVTVETQATEPTIFLGVLGIARVTGRGTASTNIVPTGRTR